MTLYCDVDIFSFARTQISKNRKSAHFSAEKAEQKSIRIQPFANVTEARREASTQRKIGISITLLNCSLKFTVNFVKVIIFHLR